MTNIICLGGTIIFGHFSPQDCVFYSSIWMAHQIGRSKRLTNQTEIVIQFEIVGFYAFNSETPTLLTSHVEKQDQIEPRLSFVSQTIKGPPYSAFLPSPFKRIFFLPVLI